MPFYASEKVNCVSWAITELVRISYIVKQDSFVAEFIPNPEPIEGLIEMIRLDAILHDPSGGRGS
jgi:hypothetical protein